MYIHAPQLNSVACTIYDQQLLRVCNNFGSSRSVCHNTHRLCWQHVRKNSITKCLWNTQLHFLWDCTKRNYHDQKLVCLPCPASYECIWFVAPLTSWGLCDKLLLPLVYITQQWTNAKSEMWLFTSQIVSETTLEDLQSKQFPGELTD